MDHFPAMVLSFLCFLNAFAFAESHCVWDEHSCRDGCDEKAMAEQCSSFPEMIACEMAERCDWVDDDRYRSDSAQSTLAESAKRAAMSAMLTVSGTQITLMAILIIFVIFAVRELSRRHRQSNARKNATATLRKGIEYGSTETVSCA